MIAYLAMWLAIAMAQSSVEHAGDRGLRRWTTREGLPQNSVVDMLQTADGSIWMATHGGITVFDGKRFRTDDVSLHPVLGTSRIVQVELDDLGRVFVGTNAGGLFRAQGSSWRAIQLPVPCLTGINSIQLATDGAMWIGSASGLFRLPRGETVAQLINTRDVQEIATSPDGSVYHSNLKGIWQCWPGELRKIGPHAASEMVTGLKGALYLAEGDRILRWRNEAWETLPIDVGFVRSLVCAPDGRLWIGSFSSLCYWDTTQLNSKPKEPSFEFDGIESLRTLMVDRDGNIWIGTDSDGIFEMYRSPIKSFPSPFGLNGQLLSVATDLEGNVYTHGPGLFRMESEVLRSVQIGLILHIARSSKGGLWIETREGIETLRDNKIEMVLPAEQLPEGRGPLLEARDGKLWIGRDALLFSWDGNQLERYAPGNIAAGQYIRCLYEDQEGRLLIGGRFGLTIFDGQQFQYLQSGKQLPIGAVRAIYESPSGDLWIGTYGSGLCRIVGDEIQRVNTSMGLFENIVSAIAPTADGHLLVMGNRAITRYSLDELEQVAAGRVPFVHRRVFDSGPNIDIFEGNGVMQPRWAVDNEGMLWFPAMHGLVRYDPTVAIEQVVPSIAMVACEVSPDALIGSHSPGVPSYTLPPGDRNVLIHFSAANFIQPPQVTYRYRLIGQDEDWIENKENHSVRYGNLPPGEYQFQIEVAVADGPYTSQESSLHLLVPATLMETLWVRRMLALFVFGGISLITYRRLRQVRRHSTELEQVVARRTQELLGEINERKRIEDELRCAGEELEDQVSSRTEELARVLENLEQDIREREHLEGRLRESEKLEVVGRLAGGLAHDFNNILTAVLGETDLALNRLEGHDPQDALAPALEEHLSHVRDAGLRASRLTRQLLAYSRQQVMQPEVIDPLETIENMHSMLTRLVPDNVRIQIQKLPHSLPVLIDPGQLEQVIVNLVVNASEAMQGGGLVLLGCRVEPDEQGRQCTVITVSDSGAGLSPEIRDHIFEPFFSTKGKARGLGLASVQGIVMQSGGCLEVRENPGRGLTFHVGFPVTDAKPKKFTPSVLRNLGPGVVALLIDDEIDVRRIVRLMLEGGGVTVLEAASPRQAIELARANGDRIHILVTDVIMPHMNGRELSKEVRALIPGIKMLFISGHFREELDERELLDTNAHFLAKPFEAKQLLSLVASLTQSSEPLSSRL